MTVENVLKTFSVLSPFWEHAVCRPNTSYFACQDVQYVDIDHMSERRDFTIDNTSFAGLPQYFDDLRKGGMRTIIILVR